MDEYEQYPEEGEAEGPTPVDGAFARINGGMLQSGKFMNQIVSLVGNIVAHDTIRTADGTEVRVQTESLAETDSGSLIVDQNKAVEIMGQPLGPNEIMVRVCVLSSVFFRSSSFEMYRFELRNCFVDASLCIRNNLCI